MTIFTNRLFIYTLFFTGVILVFSKHCANNEELKERVKLLDEKTNIENVNFNEKVYSTIDFLYDKISNSYSNIQEVEPNPPEPRDDSSKEST